MTSHNYVQTSEPLTNCSCCLHFSFLMLDWFLPCQEIGVPEKDIFDAFFAIHSN